MMIEGSGSGSRAGSGSIPLTSGSGSGSWRPKNTWIRIRIRIRNTALNANAKKTLHFQTFVKSKKLFFCQYLSFSVWFPLSLKHWSPLVCLCCGGRTDSPGGEWDGGSIFWKTREIGLPSYNDLSTDGMVLLLKTVDLLAVLSQLKSNFILKLHILTCLDRLFLTVYVTYRLNYSRINKK